MGDEPVNELILQAQSCKNSLHSVGLNATIATQLIPGRSLWKAFINGLPTLKFEQGTF